MTSCRSCSTGSRLRSWSSASSRQGFAPPRSRGAPANVRRVLGSGDARAGRLGAYFWPFAERGRTRVTEGVIEDAIVMRQIDSVTRDLVGEFGGRISPEAIERLVQRSARSYAGSRIPTYVPILIRREVRERLRQRAPGSVP